MCGRWDAADEKPWCRVGSARACGDDDTFESGGHFWSHVVCGGEGKPFDPGVTMAGAASSQQPRTAGELLRAFRAIDVSRYADRRAFHLKPLMKRGTCVCCCCHPSVTNRSLFDEPSAELDALLRREGIMGCAGIAAHLRLKPATTAVDKRLEKRVKRGTKHTIRRATLLGQEATVMRCGDNGKPCSDLGVATMALLRSSPFVVDMLGYCPGGDVGAHSGTIVVEYLPHEVVGSGSQQGDRQIVGGALSIAERKDAALRRSLGILGAVKEYHGLGRFLADFSAHQYMVDSSGRTKLMDVDCALERGQATERHAFSACLGFSWSDWGNDAVRKDTRKGGRSPWISRERDFALAATAVCVTMLRTGQLEVVAQRKILADKVGQKAGLASGQDAPMNSWLEPAEAAALQRAYRQVGDPRNRKHDLDSLADALVGALAPHMAVANK